MRRIPVVVLALALAVSACSKADRPALERVTGKIAPSAASPAHGDPNAPPVSDGTAATEGRSGTGSTTTLSTATGPGPEANDSDRVAAADGVLAAYFDALKAEDFAGAERASTGTAQFMARIRGVVARYNAERQGVTKLSYSARSFHAGAAEPARIPYLGSARLDSTVSGPAGDPHSESALFENPVVSFTSGGWHVSDYTYDGQPIALHPATSTKTVGGVELRLQGALAFGTSTGLIVDLVTDANHAIKVDNVRLRYADGSNAPSTFGALISQTPAALYYLFDRAASKPLAWTATVTIDEGTASATTADVVLRF